MSGEKPTIVALAPRIPNGTAASDPRFGTRFAISRAATGAMLGVAVAIASYIGFRLPSTWTATLDAVSLTDGFHRRIAVGTVLRPLANATSYSYWLFATFSLLVLAGVIAVLVVNAMRSELLSRRLLVVAFFLLPTGPFLFHEVGYFEQLLYLQLFASIWLVRRGRIVTATCVMSVTPFVHEIAVLTVIPVFGLVAMRAMRFRRAALITTIPALLNLFVLAIPPASEGAVETLAASLQHADFAFRTDALDLFNRTQADSWGLYKVHEVVVLVKPVALFVIGAFACLWWIDRRFWKTSEGHPALALFFVSVAAIGLPGLLVYGGWDHNRWIFLLLVNFFVVVWLSAGEGHRRDLGGDAIAVLITTLLVISHIDMFFFQPAKPRELAYRPVKAFIHKLARGKLFEIPPM